MNSDSVTESALARTQWCSSDVEQLLLERGWLANPADSRTDVPLQQWLGQAGGLLGPHAQDRTQLAAMLDLIFRYDAARLLELHESQAVLTRAGARDVIREVANQVFACGDVDSDRFKEIVDAVKLKIPYRNRALFHPIRLAVAGRAGEGELDRVILLLDAASK